MAAVATWPEPGRTMTWPPIAGRTTRATPRGSTSPERLGVGSPEGVADGVDVARIPSRVALRGDVARRPISADVPAAALGQSETPGRAAGRGLPGGIPPHDHRV